MLEVLTGGFYFECPRWHDGRWWISDFYRHEVLSVDPDGSNFRTEASVPQPGGLGWTVGDDLLVVDMLNRRLLRRRTSTLKMVTDLAAVTEGNGNDLVVDRVGRAWVGVLGYDFFGGEQFQPGAIVRVDPDGTTQVVADSLRFPNGIVISEVDETLIVAETFGARLTAFSITSEGYLVDRRPWAEFERGSFQPDGCCLDRDSLVWCADPLGRRTVHIAEGGEIVDELPSPPGTKTFACMLGGPNGTSLLQCCAPDADPSLRSVSREAILVSTEVDVPGAGRP